MKKLYNQLFEPIKNVCRKAAGRNVILMAAVLFSSHQGWGQTPVVSLSGPACTTGTITLTSSIQPERIVWQLNGVTQSTVNATWGTSGTTVAGGNGAGNATNQLKGPNSLFRDASGNIYIAEYLNNRVIEFPAGSTSATNGTVVAGTGVSGNGAAQLNGPSGLWVDGSGNIYVSDEANNRIQEFPSGSTSGTNATTVAGLGSTANSQLSSPEGLLLDASGNIYVADQFNNRIMKFPSGSTAGTTGTVVAGGNGSGSGATQLNSPTGVYLNAGGSLLVADFGNNRIQNFGTSSTSSTSATTIAGGNGSGTGATQLNNPTNVFVDGLGYLYVADAYNNRIQQFPAGSTSSTAGTTVAGSATGASGSSATLLNLPYTITMDGSGNLYTADYNNSRVQEFSPTITLTYPASTMGTWSAIVTTFTGATNTATLLITVPPAVTSSPSSSTICAGGSTTFSGSGSGSSISYQWQVSTDGGLTYNPISNGGVYSGVTTTTLTITGGTVSMNGYIYELLISGSCTPAVTTTPATLTVNSLASVTTNPSSQTICAAGNNTTGNTSFSVAGSGSGILSYQWYVSTDGGITYNPLSNGGIYSGVTATTLNLTGATTTQNGYKYRATVTSSLCAPPATSTAATLTVNPLPSITSQPSPVSVCSGGNAVFTVVSTGGSTYQWQVSTDGGATYNNVTNIVPTTGSTTPILSLSGVTTSMNGYLYRLTITTLAGCSEFSNAVLLTVYALPTVSSSPGAQTICVGSNATFNVSATGQGITYQWQLSTNGGTTYFPLGGATSSSYTVTAATAGMNGYMYNVVVSGTCTPSVTSSAATLTVQTPPGVITSPQPATVCAGTNATFTVVPSGNPIAYQWQLSTDGGLTYNNIPSANAVSYTVVAPGSSMNGYLYRVVISPAGVCTVPVTSSGAVLNVNTAPAVTSTPVSTTICAGTNTSFTVTGTGTALTYQWQVSTNGGSSYSNVTNTGVYTGATTATLNITNPAAGMNGYLYNAVLSGTCPPAVTSVADTLHVNPLPLATFSAIPAICAGTTTASMAFTGASNVSTYSIAWGAAATTAGFATVTNAAFPGSSPLSIAVPAGAASNTYTGTLTLNSGFCSATYPISITVNALPTITTQPPVSTTICQGTNTSFVAAATGTALTYQWSVSTNGGATYNALTNTGVYGGTTTNTLSITNATTSMNGYLYQLTATGTCTPPAIFNIDTLHVNTTTSIPTAGQPQSQVICAGQTATFTVSALGSNLTYQWYRSTDGGTTFNPLTGQTGASHTTVASTQSGYQYYVVVTGSCGTATSNTVTVTINTLPTITTQAPVSTTICQGNNDTLTAAATGTGIGYQWSVSTNGGSSYSAVSNGGVYSGAGTNQLIITAAPTSMNGYLYKVTVSGTCTPAAVGNVDTLHVNTTTSIPTAGQPQNATVCVGNVTTFTVAALGSNLTYQWYRSIDGGSTFQPLTGQTSASHTTVSTSQNGYQYYVVVTGSCGTVTSNTVTLTVNPAPSITTQPVSSTTICAGSNDSFSVVAAGYNLSYQWQVSTNGGTTYTALTNTAPYSGVTTSQLNITAASAALNGYQYNVVVSGGCNPSPVTSTAGVLHVNIAPSITTQPAVSNTLCSGLNDTVRVVASGSNLTYQWNVNQGSGFNTISGATTNTLVVPAVTTSMNGYQYNVTVSGSCGVFTSTNNTLHVNATPAAPTAQALALDSVCQFGFDAATGGSPLTIAATGGPSGAWYRITGPNNYNSGATQANPVTVNNGPDLPYSGTYYIYDSVNYGGTNYCISSTTTNTIAILPVPVYSGAGPVTPAVCYGQTINFFASFSAPNPISYVWYGPTNGSNFSPNGNPTNSTLCYCDTVTLNNGSVSKQQAQFTDGGPYYVIAYTVIGSHTCYFTSPSTTLTVNPLPATPTVTPNSHIDSVCQSSPISLTASSTTGGVSYKWTGPNGPTDIQNTATYSQAAATFANLGHYSVTATSSTTGCVSLPDTLWLNVKAVPNNPTATSNSPICAGATLNLTATSATADSFSWSGPGIPAFSSNQQNPSIASTPVSDAGNYIVTAYKSRCASLATATAAVIVNPIPGDPAATVARSPVCVGQPINFSVTDTSTSSTVTYRWVGQTSGNISTAQNYTIPSAQLTDAGTYDVYAYFPPGYPNGCHSANPGVATVTVNPLPATPTITNTSPVCAGGSLHLTFNDATSGATPLWSGPGITSNTGSNPPTLVIESFAGVPQSDSGIYTVYADLNGCYSALPATTHVVIYPVPANPVASSNSPVCAGNTLKLFADSNVSVTLSPLHYVWSGPSFTALNSSRNPVIGNAQVSYAGIDSVYTVDTFNCRSLLPGTVNVVINPVPNSPVVNNITLCQDQPTGPLTATGTNLRWYSSLSAFDTGTTVAPIPSDSVPGIYTYYVSQAFGTGCPSARSALIVTVNQKPSPPFVTSTTISYCQFDVPVVLSATGQNLLWYTAPAGTGTPIAPTPSTVAAANYIYYVTQTVNGCQSNEQPITVIVKQKPQAPIVQDVSYCQNDAAAALTAIGQNIRWYNVGYGGVGTPIPPVPQTSYPDTTIYYVTQTVNGCESDRVPQHVYIFYRPNVVIKTLSSYVCQHDTMTFFYFGSALPSAAFDWGLPPGASIVASESPDNIVVRFDSAGDQNITLTVSNGNCKSATETLIVKVRPQPYAAISSLHSVCEDDVVVVGLTGETVGTQYYNYNFDSGTVVSSASPGGPYNIKWTTPGIHIVKLVTTLNACQSPVETDTVNVHPTPDAHIVSVDAQDLNNICSGDSVMVGAGLINPGYQYQWSPTEFFTHGNNAPKLQANITFSGPIYLKVISDFGCIGNDSTYVTIQPCCNLYLPNAFTPNGDGHNDFFHILTIGHHVIRDFRVVNRWGQTVFETTDEKGAWDGKYNNVPQDMDTYYWFVEYVCEPSGKEMKEQGEVYLVR